MLTTSSRKDIANAAGRGIFCFRVCPAAMGAAVEGGKTAFSITCQLERGEIFSLLWGVLSTANNYQCISESSFPLEERRFHNPVFIRQSHRQRID